MPKVIPNPTRAVTAEEALGFPAARLFVERARVSQPDFVLGDEDVEAVVEICRHLDGLPLALEPAAARIRMLSVASLRATWGTPRANPRSRC